MSIPPWLPDLDSDYGSIGYFVTLQTTCYITDGPRFHASCEVSHELYKQIRSKTDNYSRGVRFELGEQDLELGAHKGNESLLKILKSARAFGTEDVVITLDEVTLTRENGR